MSVGYPVTKTSSWAPSFKTYPQVSLSCHSYIPRDQWMLRVLTIPRVFLMWSWAGTVPSPRMKTIPGIPGSGALVTEFLTLELYLCLSCTLISSRDLQGLALSWLNPDPSGWRQRTSGWRQRNGFDIDWKYNQNVLNIYHWLWTADIITH